MQLLVFS